MVFITEHKIDQDKGATQKSLQETLLDILVAASENREETGSEQVAFASWSLSTSTGHASVT